jgi:hypothetical protein
MPLHQQHDPAVEPSRTFEHDGFRVCLQQPQPETATGSAFRELR